MDSHDLYGLPLDRFVPERTALAKALRKEGRRQEADDVAALRKPSVAAWAVNQLVRTQGRAIARLYDAGDAAQQAQAQLISGRADGKALRDSIARERAAVGELVDNARGLLSSEGHELTPAMLERVSETFHAAALDKDARAQVKDGCLHRELRRVGLGTGGEVAPAPKTRRAGGSTAGPRTATPSKAAPGTPSRAGQRHDADHAQRLRTARRAEADARRLAERAVRELASAQERRDKLAASLKEAEAAFAAAKQREKGAQREHNRARDALARLRR
jgi:hypothetical protein